MNRLLKILISIGLILIVSRGTFGQGVPVALTPVPHMQFLDVNGKPLAGGKVCTFQAGTTNPAATYVDINGVILNSNPVRLDAGGFATIYLANQSYKIVVLDGSGADGTCNTGVQQWVQDNVNAFQAVTGTPSILFASVTVDPVGTAGLVEYRSDIPCLRLFTTIWDCIATLNAPQSFTNKNIDITLNNIFNDAANLAGHYMRNNGTKYVDSPLLASDAVTIYPVPGVNQPVVNQIAKIIAGSAQVAQTTDTNGFGGICVANCGVGLQPQIQSLGIALCVFDGATTVNDYVINSPTVTGNCHDSGVAPPQNPGTTAQLIGRVLSNNGGPGTYQIEVFPPEITLGNKQGAAPGCTNFTPVTVSANNAQQNLQSCVIPANTLVQGSLLNVDVTGIESTAAGQTITITVSLGAGTACLTQITAGVANNQPWNFSTKFSVLTVGAGGTANMSCEYFSSASGGGVIGPSGVVGAPTIAVNTTIANTLLIQEQMSVNNAGNSVTSQLLKAVVF